MANQTPGAIMLIGGGFSDGTYLELDDHLFSLSPVERPKICFIPTASGDSQNYIARFYAAMERHECIPTHLELFNRTVKNIDVFLSEQDIIYVGGGNTANLLTLWRLHGVASAVLAAYRSGTILAGISAGSACWFDSCLTDSYGQLDSLRDGLGLLEGSFCPHFNTEDGRPAAFQEAVQSGKLPPGYALDDGAGAVFREESFAYTLTIEAGADLHLVG